MRGLVLAPRKIAALVLTADDWELFTVEHAARSAEAAAALNKAIADGVNAGKTRREVSAQVYEVQKAYRDVGAADSEPMWMLSDVLDGVYGQ